MDDLHSNSEIYTTLSAILVEALRVDRSKINLNSKIFNDLGAESIDILDIRFRVEEAFAFKIEQEEIVRSLGEGLTARQFQENFTVGSLVGFIKDRLVQKERAI